MNQQTGCRSLSRALLWLTGLVASAASADGAPLRADHPLTANALVEAVLDVNPGLRVREADWQAAQAGVVPARSLDDPRLSFVVAPRTLNDDRLRFGSVLPGVDAAQQVQVTQMLPWPGKLALKGQVARLEANASREEIARARLTLTAAAREAASDWHFVHAAIRINEHHRGLWQEFQRIAETKYSAGRAGKQEALQAAVEGYRVERHALELQRRRDEVRAAINALLDRVPDDPVPPPAPLDRPGALPDVAALRALALQSRPELMALGYRRQAAGRGVGLAEKARYPDFMLMAMYDGIWDAPERRGQIGISVNIPLPERRRAGVDEARARQIRVQHEIDQKRAEILSEVDVAHARVRESIDALRLYEEQLLPLARESLAAAQADYLAGRADLLGLISAERNLAQVELEAEQTVADYHRRLARLDQAVGAPAPDGPVSADTGAPR